jgi:hypothetical protein
MSNAIQIITPYHYEGTWVFDDSDVDLLREPFVEGMPEIIDAILDREGLAACARFRLLFSANPFPSHQAVLEWESEEVGGNWYHLPVEPQPMRGWLCPALLKYFDAAPERLYVKAEPLP